MEPTQETTSKNPENATPAATPIAGPGQIVIDKSDFEKLISTITEQNKKIDVLFQAADKNRLARAYAGADGESLIKTVKVSKFSDNDKLIVGWKLTSNQSEIINNRWIEKQDTMLVFEDGTTLEIPLLDFYRKIVKEKAEIVSRVRKEDNRGKEIQILKLRFKDGKELEIDSAFIN